MVYLIYRQCGLYEWAAAMYIFSGFKDWTSKTDILGTTYPYMQCVLDLKNDSPDLHPIHTPEVISLRSIWLHIGESVPAVQLLL